jgi:DNA-binding MarR family transcriptional regulator
MVARHDRIRKLGTMTRWLDDEEMRAWRNLIEVTNDVKASLDAELVDAHGITEGDYGVLVNLSEAPGQAMRMCDLACRLHLSPSGLTRRLDGLVRAGLVARRQDSDDRRVTLAVLTADGMATLRAAAPLHVDGVRRHLINLLSRTQIRQLGAAFSGVARKRRALAPTPDL